MAGTKNESKMEKGSKEREHIPNLYLFCNNNPKEDFIRRQAFDYCKSQTSTLALSSKSLQ